MKNIGKMLEMEPLKVSFRKPEEPPEKVIEILTPRKTPGAESLEQMGTEIDELEKAVDIYFGFRPEEPVVEHKEKIYYKDLRLTELGGGIRNEKESFQDLEMVLETILSNPYSVKIGNPRVETYPFNLNYIKVRLTITYSLKLTVINELSEILPFEKTKGQDNFDRWRYKAQYTSLSPEIISSSARGEYRVIPVIKFLNENNEPRVIIIDSIDLIPKKYESGSIPIIIVNQFRQLITLVPGPQRIEIFLRDC
jgi:hypothetical protein